MKKAVFILFFLVFLFTASPILANEDLIIEEGVSSSTEELTIYFFDDRLCPVCRDTKNFLQEKAEEDDNLNLIIYPISDVDRLREMAEEYEVEDFRIMAPSIFMGDNFFQFRDFTSREEEKLLAAIKGETVDKDCCIVKIPFLNIEIDISGWSLPLITIILGSIDGFNICSIGALILILSIVFVFNSKKKIFFFGGLFIITTVIIYGLLVFVWGRLFEVLIGHLEILRIIVGLAALGGGIYFFKEFWRFFKYGPTCQTSESKIAKKATEKVKKVFEKEGQGLIVLAGAVVTFAAVITIVELPCSIGIPLAFSGILVESGVSLTGQIGYILLFLFFYMLIEIIIFTGAVLTKSIWIADSKVITWITFFGSLVLFYLAFYYLFS